jgi:hypothetical protein
MRAGFAHAATMIGLLVLEACRGGGPSKLQGRWQGVRAEGVDPEAQAASDEFATSLSMEFKGDVVSVATATEKQSGRYAVVNEDKGMVVIAIADDAGDERETFTLVDDRTVKWSIGDTKRIILTRR